MKKFLDYTGKYDVIDETNFIFSFQIDNKIIKEKMAPIFIVPPVYDVTFKSIFFYDENGMELTKDILNSLLFPASHSIKKIKSFASKEILSTSNIKNNKGTRKVDNAFIASIKGKDKDIIIVFEMQKNFRYSNTERFYDYGNGLRRTSGFLETWVIALCFDNSKNPREDKGSNSHMIKKYNISNDPEALNYIHIYEIYLNDLHKNINNKISIFNNEIIEEEGKEWIKLFTIIIWSKYYKSDINYVIPSELFFKGKKISEAIKILSDIQDIDRLQIETQNHALEVDKEENQKIINDKYNEGFKHGYGLGEEKGYQEGEANGYIEGEAYGYKEGEAYGYRHGYLQGKEQGEANGIQKGYQQGEANGIKKGYQQGEADGIKKGYQQGEEKGIQKGHQNLILQILDYYFINYSNGKSIENIESVGKVPSGLVFERYSSYPQVNGFIQILSSKNLLY